LIPVPTINVSSASVTEGNSGTTTVTLTISLSGPAQNTVQATWSTVAGTALAGSDFNAASGTVAFTPGGFASQTITITINGDTTFEPNETFTVALSNVANAKAGANGTVTIVNDDADPGVPLVNVTATDATGAEQGSDPIVFKITRTGSTASAITISLDWTAGTATFGTDYTVTATGGTLGANAATIMLAAGVASATITVTPVDDKAVEGTESVVLTLGAGVGYAVGSPASASGTIVDNDTPPSISIGNAQVTEGNKNTSNVTITVTLSNPWTSPITVHVATADGTALAGQDYNPVSTNLTFAAGVTSLTFTVAIIGDTVHESTETFTVVLSSPTGGATIAVGTGTVTIIDNDAAMMAASSAPAGAQAEPLTTAALAPVVATAEQMWRSVLPGADFRGLTVTIADLPGDQLGWTVGKQMTIDATAAGFGWDQMDLLTVVLHELGRALGFTTADAAWFGVMAPTLAPGERLTLISPKWIRPLRPGVIRAGRTVVKSAALP
jgi:chitinase